MAEPKDPTPPAPYPVEPDPEEGEQPQLPREGRRGRRAGRIEEPGLLEDFDEDADFTADPELEAAIVAGARSPEGGAAEKAPRAEAAPLGPVLVRGGPVADKVWLIAAGIALLVAITMALIWQEQAKAAHVGLTIYGAAVNTGLGLASIYLAARLLDRRLGDFERALAPVAFAACVAQVVRQIPIDLVGTADNQIEELTLAAAVYTLVLWALFRWEARTLGVVLGLHFLVWLVIKTGGALQSCAATAGVGGA